MAKKRVSRREKKPELMPQAGGQAVIEGVLMRSKRFYAVAVRTPKGKIIIKKGPVKSQADRFKFLKWPVLRGFWALVESMALGFKGLDYSARIFEDGEKKPVKRGKKRVKISKAKQKAKEDFAMAMTYVVSIVIAIAVFIYLPVQLTKLLAKAAPALDESRTLFNSSVVTMKFIFFFLYVWGISFMDDVKRLFMYHGAEHRAIYAYEDGKSITVKNMEKYRTMHPRCGTAFMFITILVSVVVFILLLPPHYSVLKRVLLELPLIPLIAGLSYELLKYSARHQKNPLMRLFIAPGMAFQRITTKVPDKKQMLVAAAALNAVVAMEKKKA